MTSESRPQLSRRNFLAESLKKTVMIGGGAYLAVNGGERIAHSIHANIDEAHRRHPLATAENESRAHDSIKALHDNEDQKNLAVDHDPKIFQVADTDVRDEAVIGYQIQKQVKLKNEDEIALEKASLPLQGLSALELAGGITLVAFGLNESDIFHKVTHRVTEWHKNKTKEKQKKESLRVVLPKNSLNE